MILNDYYKAVKLPNIKSKLRYDVVESTQSYEPFEILINKKGKLFFYYCNIPEYFKGSAKRKADKILTNCKGKNVSSVFVPDVRVPFGYGDVYSTSDLILFVFNGDYTLIELFIARGQINNKTGVYNLLCDGELDNEIELLRKQAKKS